MICQDLHQYVDRLERLGELHRLQVEVDPFLEIAAITDRVCKLGGKALLFEKVRGSRFPVATNLFGSDRRLAAALDGEEFAAAGERLARLLDEVPDGSLAEKLAALPSISDFARFLPKVVASGPCQDVVEDEPDLASYPFLKGWPGDGLPDHDGRFITLPLVFTRDADSGRPNCGMYRVALVDDRRGAIHWYPGRGGERHYRTYRAGNRRMPVAVALGGAPACTVAAVMPLPEDLDEMHIAGFLLGAPVEMVRCRTSELLVPAHAELVIEGYLEPGETVRDGAFGNHTGFYSRPADVPLLRVTAVTRRRDCICPATVVGPPPMEDCHLARCVWRLLLPLLQREIPEMADIDFPPEWVFHGSGIVSIRNSAPGTGRETIARLWQNDWFRSARFLAVVDADQDIRDLAGVAWRIINYADWERDLMVSSPAGDSTRQGGLPGGGSRLAIDATRKETTAAGAPWPREMVRDESISRLVTDRWKEYGL